MFRNTSIKRNILTRAYTGSKIVYDKLLEKNVKHVFLYSGGAIMPLVDHFYDGQIKFYVNTHEQSGGHAATGYAKSSNEVGVAIVTSGPGLTNMVTPLQDANSDSTPLVLFSGQVSTANMGSDAFQECPATDITRSVTKWNYCVKDTDELPYVIDNAFKIANSGKKGAVHIDLPKDILVNEFSENSVYSEKHYKKNQYKVDIPDERFLEVAKLINQSKKPIFYIGKGCNDYSDQLRNLVDKANIPITTTIHAMGVYDEAKELSLQFLGMHGHIAANYSIQEADCIIAIGSRFDDRTTGSIKKYAPETTRAYNEGRGGIIHCNIESSEINKVIETGYNFNCDAGYFIEKLEPLIENKVRTDWLEKTGNWKKTYPFYHEKAENGKIKTQDVIREINRQVVDKNIWDKVLYTSGVGNHQMMASQFIDWKIPKSFITSGSLGVMGVGLPYAIGCQIANSDKIIIDIDGDSSFNHTLSELKTLVEYNLPVKIAVMNDKNQSMVRVWEELFFDERFTATASEKNPDYKLLAESYGVKGINCDNIDDLEKTIDYFISYQGPILCDFKVLSDKCLPLVAPGSGLDEMIVGDRYGNCDIVFDKTLPPS